MQILPHERTASDFVVSGAQAIVCLMSGGPHASGCLVKGKEIEHTALKRLARE